MASQQATATCDLFLCCNGEERPMDMGPAEVNRGLLKYIYIHMYTHYIPIYPLYTHIYPLYALYFLKGTCSESPNLFALKVPAI